MTRKALAMLAAMSLAAAWSSAQDKITLKQKYTPGKYEVKQVVTSQMETATAGQQVSQDMEMTMVLGLNVAKPDEKGTIKVEMTFDKIKQKVSSGGKAVLEYDSEAAAQTGPLASVYKSLLSAKISFEVTVDGKIQKAKGLEEIWDSMAKDNPAMAPMADTMKKQFGNAMLENLMTQAAKSFPEKSVAVGDTWKVDTKMNVPIIGELNVSQDCKLKAIEGKLAVLDITSKAKTEKAVDTKLGPMTVTIDKMETTQTGTMKVDTESGMAVQQNWDGTMDMSMSMQGPDGEKMQTTSKQKMKIEVTMTKK
jgi:hypothetical protein